MLEEQEELTAKIKDASRQLADLLLPIREQKINVVPYEGSWTAGQLFSHVTKALKGMGNVMEKPAARTDRDPAQRIEELRRILLDFSHTLKSPEFIMPGPGPFDKQAILTELTGATGRLVSNASHADMTELVSSTPFGPATKWEIYHFALFHTQRHLNQMKKIADALA